MKYLILCPHHKVISAESMVTLVAFRTKKPVKKELRRIILKLFLVVAYLIVGTVFIYLTFDNSFWLIDNGNSGFVGKITYNFINTWAPVSYTHLTLPTKA